MCSNTSELFSIDIEFLDIVNVLRLGKPYFIINVLVRRSVGQYGGMVHHPASQDRSDSTMSGKYSLLC